MFANGTEIETDRSQRALLEGDQEKCDLVWFQVYIPLYFDTITLSSTSASVRVMYVMPGHLKICLQTYL